MQPSDACPCASAWGGGGPVFLPPSPVPQCPCLRTCFWLETQAVNPAARRGLIVRTWVLRLRGGSTHRRLQHVGIDLQTGPDPLSSHCPSLAASKNSSPPRLEDATRLPLRRPCHGAGSCGRVLWGPGGAIPFLWQKGGPGGFCGGWRRRVAGGPTGSREQQGAEGISIKPVCPAVTRPVALAQGQVPVANPHSESQPVSV